MAPLFWTLFALVIFALAQSAYEHYFVGIGRAFVDDYVHYAHSYDESYSKENVETYHNQNNVAIVKVDDRTLDANTQGDIASLSLKKAFWAQVVKNLFEKYGAAVVGMDIVFVNRTNAKDEKLFAEALAKYKDRVVLGTRGDNSLRPFCTLNDIPSGATEVNNDALDVDGKIRQIVLQYPNYVPDTNTCVKTKTQTGAYHFSLELYRRSLMHYQAMTMKEASEVTDEFLASTPTVKTASGALHWMYLNFFLDPSIDATKTTDSGLFGYRGYSLIDIYRGALNDEQGNAIDLKDKVVLVGEVGTLFQDKHITPTRLTQEMPWVEIQANAFQTIANSISGTKPYRQDVPKNMLLLLLAVTSALLFGTLFYISRLAQKTGKTAYAPFFGLLAVALFGIVHYEIGYNFFGEYLYPVGNLFYIIALTFVGFYLYSYFVIEKNKRFLKTAFSRYVSPDMVNIILKNPEKLSLQGEESDVTILFSDIAGFTNLSEKMSPTELFAFLNRYLEKMTDILNKNKGTLDKYIWDAVMGFFNAPIAVEDHAYVACLTAIEQIQALEELNQEWAPRGLPKIAIRIGLNTGTVIAGNLWSTERFNYTIIGDEVNLASRLEGINKYYGTSICVSQATYHQTKERFVFRELDRIRVKGKELPITIYELVAIAKPNTQELIGAYEKALKLYYEGKYADALPLFENQEKEDSPSATLANRCRELLAKNIVLAGGVYTMTDK